LLFKKINNNYLKLKEKLKEVQKYYKEYLFESKKEDIINIEKIINNNEDDISCEIYLKDYELAKEMNLRAPIINYIYIEKNKSAKTEEKFKIEVESWNKIEKMIKDHKIKKMNKNMKQILVNYFNDKNNKELIMKIFNRNNYEYFINKTKSLNKMKNIIDKKEMKKINL